MVKVPTKYGTTLKNAKSMELNQTVVGLLDANKKAKVGEFYKLKLTSDTKLQLAFYVECTSGSFMLEVYDSSKKELSTSNFKCTNSSLLYINSTSEMPAGTYYFKVTKTKKATSGCYALIAKKR
jgi:protease II